MMENAGFEMEVNGRHVWVRDAYLIMAGIRGPDIEKAQEVKMLFTGRIRYFVFGEDINVPGYVRERATITASMLRCAIAEIDWIKKDPHLMMFFHHYLSHVADALWSLGRYLGGEEREEVEMLREIALTLNEYLRAHTWPDFYDALELTIRRYHRFFVDPDNVIAEVKGDSCEE